MITTSSIRKGVRPLLAAVLVLTSVVAPIGQQGSQTAQGQAAIEKVGEGLFRIGRIGVDTTRREIVVPGHVNSDIAQLEFIANTLGGVKAYESALTLETSAINFNTALVLIGLDKANARNVPTRHFDPAVPEGDRVDLWIECPGGECQRFAAERLMYDRERKETLSGGSWVYTGSSFIPQGGPYWAEADGVLIGFVHDPASIIEYTGSGALNRFGAIVTNPGIGIKGGTEILVTVKAVAQGR